MLDDLNSKTLDVKFPSTKVERLIGASIWFVVACLDISEAPEKFFVRPTTVIGALLYHFCNSQAALPLLIEATRITEDDPRIEPYFAASTELAACYGNLGRFEDAAKHLSMLFGPEFGSIVILLPH